MKAWLLLSLQKLEQVIVREELFDLKVGEQLVADQDKHGKGNRVVRHLTLSEHPHLSRVVDVVLLGGQGPSDCTIEILTNVERGQQPPYEPRNPLSADQDKASPSARSAFPELPRCWELDQV